MATITYGSEDAIYGSGVYNEAVYGEYGPTVNINGFDTTTAVGTLSVSAEANTSATGVQAVASEGTVEATGDASESLTGVEGTSALGTVSITATTGLTGQQLDSALGSVQVNIVEYVTGVFAASNTGITKETGTANHTLTSIELTGTAGNTSETGVVFDFEAVKETYGRDRTVILSRAA